MAARLLLSIGQILHQGGHTRFNFCNLPLGLVQFHNFMKHAPPSLRVSFLISGGLR
jgi:hypothetical protein